MLPIEFFVQPEAFYMNSFDRNLAVRADDLGCGNINIPIRIFMNIVPLCDCARKLNVFQAFAILK